MLDNILNKIKIFFSKMPPFNKGNKSGSLSNTFSKNNTGDLTGVEGNNPSDQDQDMGNKSLDNGNLGSTSIGGGSVKDIRDINIRAARSWYQERYESIIVQRNFLVLTAVLLLMLSIISILVIAYILNIRRFDPFVIQVDDTTGIAQVVNPVSVSILSANESLARYFIKRYVTARETYNPVDFDTEARRIVRLLSSPAVYSEYYSYIHSEGIDPTKRYGQRNTTYLTVKSWSRLDKQKYIIRFSISETQARKQIFHKIAVVEFQYVATELTEQDRDINPVGFQVTGYRVDDDNS